MREYHQGPGNGVSTPRNVVGNGGALSHMWECHPLPWKTGSRIQERVWQRGNTTYVMWERAFPELGGITTVFERFSAGLGGGFPAWAGKPRGITGQGASRESRWDPRMRCGLPWETAARRRCGRSFGGR